MTHHQYLHLLHQISQLHAQADGNYTRMALIVTFDAVAVMLFLSTSLSKKS